MLTSVGPAAISFEIEAATLPRRCRSYGRGAKKASSVLCANCRHARQQASSDRAAAARRGRRVQFRRRLRRRWRRQDPSCRRPPAAVRGYNWARSNVLQACIEPVSNPLRNQRVRCAALRG